MPPIVGRVLESRGVEVLDEPLPSPFHMAALPGWVRARWSDVTIPSLGHPLPNRLPIAKHLAPLGAPLRVSHGERVSRLDERLLDAPDAFTWAFERMAADPSAPAAPDADVACVRLDLLGDLLLAAPALRGAVARAGVSVVCRSEWLRWVELDDVLGTTVRTCGVDVHAWREPTLAPARTVVDLSPPGWSSPLTPAVARATPASERRCVPADAAAATLAGQAAAALGVDSVATPRRTTPVGDVGLLIAGGSSGERWMPAATWRMLLERAGGAFDIARWLVTADGDEAALASELPGTEALPFPIDPRVFAALLGRTRLFVGTSTGLAHLATVAGVPGIVVEHPTTRAGWYRVADANVAYVRAARPWWTESPTEDDVRRALQSRESYGFGPGEWEAAIDRAIGQLGA